MKTARIRTIKLLSLSVLTALCVALFASCSVVGTDSADKYAITVVNGTGGGTYDKGEQVTVTATVQNGWTFVKWLDGETEVSTENPYTFTVEKDVTLTAVTQEKTEAEYVIRYFFKDGENFVEDSGLAERKTGKVGDEVVVEPDEIDGYVCINGEDELKGVIKSDGSLAITLNYAPACVVTVIGGTGSKTYAAGTEATVTATLGDGIKFVKWLEGETEVSAENPYTFTVEGDITLVAVTEYIDELKEVMAEINAAANVTAYTVKTYFAEKGTYEYEVFTADYDLLSEQTIAEKFNEAFAGMVANKDDTEYIETAKGEIIAELLDAYKVFVYENTLTVAREISAILDYGVFNDGSDTVDGLAGGGTYFYKDPTAADGRWWIPEGYKTNVIIDYVNITKNTAENEEQLSKLHDDAILSVTKAMFTKIAEGLALYALTNNGQLTVGGGAASEWWYLWTYIGTEGYDYDGVVATYDPTAANYRLCGAIFDRTNSAYLADLNGTLNLINWVIAHQVDDMFAPVG